LVNEGLCALEVVDRLGPALLAESASALRGGGASPHPVVAALGERRGCLSQPPSAIAIAKVTMRFSVAARREKSLIDRPC
jgi:hypothetical protein